jgi:aspartate 1-decarboxylase
VTDTETKTEISTVVVSGEETSVVQVDNGASVDTYIIDNTEGSDQPISVVVPE